MLSGRETLSEINRTLDTVRREYAQLEREMHTAAESMTELQLKETQALKALATERIDQLSRGQITRYLDEADRRAGELLTARNRARAELGQAIEAQAAQLKAIEGERDDMHLKVESVAQELADLEALVQRHLDEDQGYQAQLATTREAQSIAAEADEKTKLAEQDRTEKGQPYEQNKLFSYLWKRKYGTSDYAANSLVQTLDDWVADLCDYESARRNYWMLLEIPKRLAEHARMVTQRAEAELRTLQQLELEAAETAGLDAAQERLHEAETAQDEIDARIDLAEQELANLHEQQNRFAIAEDDYSLECIHILSAAYENRDVRDLRAMARETYSESDDRLVRELDDLRDDREDLTEELKDNRALLEAQAARLKELEDIRRRFKRHRYDDLRSSFGGERLIRMVLNEFLRGAVGGGGVWDTLKRHQRYKDIGGAWPDFGSAGLPKRRRGGRSPWHWPGGRGGFRMPRRGGSRSRGGFRTGGGF